MRIECTEKMKAQEDPVALIKRMPIFTWNGEEEKQTIDDLLERRAAIEAHSRLSSINESLNLNSQNVIAKVKPRALTWQIDGLMKPFEDTGAMPIPDFLELLKTGESDAHSESDFWILDTLGYETRAAAKKVTAAKTEKDRLIKETFKFKISNIKHQPDEEYGDAYNRLVSQLADQTGMPMREADKNVQEKIEEELSDEDVEAYLADTIKQNLETRLRNYYKSGLNRLQDPEKAGVFTVVMFELDARKTNEIWQGRRKKFEDILARGINGETIDLVSILCTINQYDFKGHYTLVPDIFAYKKEDDVQLEPVPLIIDELAQVVGFFKFHGINAPMTLYVSDADYTESKQCGPVTEANLQNLQEYMQNLRKYLADRNLPLSLVFMTEATMNNPDYQASKGRIYANLTKWDDPAFTKEWSKPFEEDRAKRLESQKKRGFFSEADVEGETLEIVRRIWSVNGGQGTYFGILPENIIMVSTERRERDQNYTIDLQTREQFIPVIYILHAADKWTRKIRS